MKKESIVLTVEQWEVSASKWVNIVKKIRKNGEAYIGGDCTFCDVFLDRGSDSSYACVDCPLLENSICICKPSNSWESTMYWKLHDLLPVDPNSPERHLALFYAETILTAIYNAKPKKQFVPFTLEIPIENTRDLASMWVRLNYGANKFTEIAERDGGIVKRIHDIWMEEKITGDDFTQEWKKLNKRIVEFLNTNE